MRSNNSSGWDRRDFFQAAAAVGLAATTPRSARWTVRLNEYKSRTGTSYSKGNAIFKAVNAIDKALGIGSGLALKAGEPISKSSLCYSHERRRWLRRHLTTSLCVIT
jgi:hypothetical protein